MFEILDGMWSSRKKCNSQKLLSVDRTPTKWVRKDVANRKKYWTLIGLKGNSDKVLKIR